MKLFRRALAGAAALLLLALAQTAQAAPALWAVRDHDSTIYLFGTMHILSPETRWRTPEYDKALADSSVVWFETDVEADAETVGRAMARYAFDFRRPLKDKVSPATMAKVRKAMKGFAGDPRMVEYMQPWIVAMMVQVAPAARSGLTSVNGADMTISRDLTTDDQIVRYFETVEGQLRILADLPQNVQVRMLEDAVAGIDAVGLGEVDAEDIDFGESAWVNGDIQLYGSAMAIAMRDSRPALYEALLRRRNQAWAAILAREMRGRGVEMVNVGALHLVGEEGLVALLRKRGFVVERIQ
ncbi:MAG: TraB/GumN family protein [Caulobacterales bacterium]|nr:TraB/GumN family protein [Caulobacterales bacterium]